MYKFDRNHQFKLTFWRAMLQGKKNVFSSCAKCEYIYYAANENIDGFMEKILERMG